MDKLFDSYKEIVDRAIFLGLLTEESKPYYLSAYGEDAVSDSSIKASNSWGTQVEYKQLPTSFEKAHNLSRTKSGELKQIYNPTVELNVKKVKDEDWKDKTPVSGRSIENYSILDINNLIKMTSSVESDSEMSDILKIDRNISAASAIKLKKVRKKPKKNEIVDFQIPIYLDVSRKKGSSKPLKNKRNFSLRKKGCTNIEASTLQNEDEKDLREEKIMNKKPFQEYKPKHCSKIPRRINFANKNKNAPKLIRCDSGPDCTYKYIERSLQEISSPKGIEKNACPFGIVSTPTMLTYSKNRNVLQLPRRTIKRVNNTEVNKENVDEKEKCSTAFQSIYERGADKRSKHESKYTLFKSFHGKEFTPNVLDSENLSQFSENGEIHTLKYVKECKHFEEPESLSEVSSWKESTDSEAKEQSSQKLINLNIFCQFFSSGSSGGGQDAAHVENGSQSEQVENEKITSIDSEAQPPKVKSSRRSTAHFFSKLFSKTRTH